MIGVEYGVCSNQASRAHPTGKEEEKYMQPTKSSAHASRSSERIREVYAATAGCAHASRSPDTVKGEVYAATKGRAHASRSPDKLKLVFFGRGF